MGDIRDLIERITEKDVIDYAKELSGEDGSLQESRVSDKTGPLHPFGIDRAVNFVQSLMQRFGYEVELGEYRGEP